MCFSIWLAKTGAPRVTVDVSPMLILQWSILTGDFISKHRLRAAGSVSAALKKLIGNELVYQTADGYIIYDRFMGEWLRNQVF